MVEDSEEPIDAILCFDANMPKMENCGRNCKKVDMILCKHRFNFNARIVRCNTPKFEGWPDSKILLYFLNHVNLALDLGQVTKDCLFVILTRDHDFLKDARSELGHLADDYRLDFHQNFVACGDIVVFVQLVECQRSKRMNDRRCAIQRMNTFFHKHHKA